MTDLLEPIGLGLFALRVSERPPEANWMLLAVPPPLLTQTEQALQEELAILEPERPTRRLDAASGPAALIDVLETNDKDIALISGFEGYDAAAWRHLDLLRSRMQRPEASVLLMSEEAAGRLMQEAPNLASWIGGRGWRLDPGAEFLEPSEVEERLQALRERFGLTDEEVIAQAESGQLPPDPELGEWLILLGRGELTGDA